MNTITFNNPHFIEYKNLTDTINGISLTLTSSNKNFDYTEAYLILPEINKVLYESVGVKPYTLKNHTKPPTDKEIEMTLLMGQLVCAYSIAPNQNNSNFHIHLYCYGLSNYAKSIGEWIYYVETELKKLKPFSRKNRYSIVIKPITDCIDKGIRETNSYKSLTEYLTNPDYDTFLHYLIYRNNKQLIYHYA
jgi:hypothetical protein